MLHAPPSTKASEAADEVVEVTSYAEVVEALRLSAKLAVVMDEESRRIRGATVLRLDGEPHARRRRVLNRLVLRDRHAFFRERVLAPAVDRELAAILARRDGDGVARTDLAEFCTRVLVELVAAMIGLDGARTPEGLDELVELHAHLVEFPKLQTQLRAAAPPLPEGAASLRRALEEHEAAKRRFVNRFYGPALEARERLVTHVAAGELSESELPADLLTLVAAHADPAFASEADLGTRTAIIDFLHAGTGTSVGAVLHAIDEIERHVATHLEDAVLRIDPAFLAGAMAETLRLHSANPAEVRRALEDVTLSGGTTIRAGQLAAMRTGYANRDRSVFGADADCFDPHRALPRGVSLYGVAFGAGPHMCYGLPFALGNVITDGNLVLLVRRLYEADVAKDPEQPVRRRGPIVAHADLKRFETFPVVFAAPARR